MTDANGFYWLNSEETQRTRLRHPAAGHMNVPTVKAMPQFWQPCTLDQTPSNNSPRSSSGSGRRQRLVPTVMLVGHGHAPANRNPRNYVKLYRRRLRQGVDIGPTTPPHPESHTASHQGDVSWDGSLGTTTSGRCPMQPPSDEFIFPDVVGVMGKPRQRPLCSLRFRRRKGPYRQHMGPFFYALNIGRIHNDQADNTE